MKLLLELKYQVAQPETKDELYGIDIRDLPCEVYKLKKLVSDRLFFTTVIVTTYKELIQDKTTESLKITVNSIINLENYRVELFEKELKNKAIRRDLYKQMRQQRNHIKSALYDNDVTIEELRNKVEDANLNAEMRNRYVEHWQRARTEQHHQTIYKEEALPTNTTEYYKQKIESEQRVHSEAELLINISINETLDKIENWMTIYDKDIEDIDLKIQIKKNDYQNILDRRIDLEATILKHDELIFEWINFKEKRETARLYREKMTNSAIIVQAWWRGLLVRHQLGPYRVSKKKNAKKK